MFGCDKEFASTVSRNFLLRHVSPGRWYEPPAPIREEQQKLTLTLAKQLA